MARRLLRHALVAVLYALMLLAVVVAWRYDAPPFIYVAF